MVLSQCDSPFVTKYFGSYLKVSYRVYCFAIHFWTNSSLNYFFIDYYFKYYFIINLTNNKHVSLDMGLRLPFVWHQSYDSDLITCLSYMVEPSIAHPSYKKKVLNLLANHSWPMVYVMRPVKSSCWDCRNGKQITSLAFGHENLHTEPLNKHAITMPHRNSYSAWLIQIAFLWYVKAHFHFCVGIVMHRFTVKCFCLEARMNEAQLF